jgi:hypothetical protein
MPALAVSCGLALAGAAPPGAFHAVNLRSQSSAGVYGTAVLVPLAAKTKVIVVLDNDAPGAVHPSHIHTGTCAHFNPLPQFPLNDVVNGKAVTIVDAPLAALLGHGFVLEVHSSKYHVNIIAACGAL